MILLLPLLLRLGFWQLDRAVEKQGLMASFVERQALPPASLSQLLALEHGERAYRRVTLEGHFQSEPIFLLDNQIQFGKVGYNVLQALLVERDAHVHYFIINRGWLAGSPDRSLPTIDTPKSPIKLTASLYVPAGAPVLLTEDRWEEGPIRVIQSVDIDKIALALDVDTYPYQLRIEPGEPGALSVDWQIASTSPEKHRGYAVQWFAMSLALLLLWLYSSLRRQSD